MVFDNLKSETMKEKSNSQKLLEMLRSDGSIIINKNLAHAIGLNSVIIFTELLSKYIYFADRKKLTKDGFFYCTILDLKLSTTLSGKQQRNEIKRLEELKLIKHINFGIPKKRYFKIIADFNMISNMIFDHKSIMNKQKVTIIDSENDLAVVPKGNINNTNNNTKNNNHLNELNGSSFHSEPHSQSRTSILYRKEPSKELEKYKMNLIIISRILKGESLISFQRIVKHYFKHYENSIGTEHPVLKEEYWDRVIENIQNFMNENNIDFKDLYKIIDGYFETKLDCDRNIIHFATEGILERRFYEKLYRFDD